jgi:hypothetical protein
MVGEAVADSEGEESNARMVDEAFGFSMEDGADLEVALGFTKCLFDFDKVFVVAFDLRGICTCDGERRYQSSWAVLAAASLERAASASAMRNSRRSHARFLRHGPPPMTWRLPLALFQ